MRLHVFLSVVPAVFRGIAERLHGCSFSITAKHPFDIDEWAGLAALRGGYKQWASIETARHAASSGIAGMDHHSADYGRIVTADARYFESWESGRVRSTVAMMSRHTSDAFDKFCPDVLLMDNVACASSFLHYLEAKRRNIPAIMIGASRIPGHIVLHRDPYQMPHGLEEAVASHLHRPESQSGATEFADEVIRARARPSVSERPEQQDVPLLTTADLRNMTSHTRRWLAYPSDYLSYATPWGAAVSRGRRLIRARGPERGELATRIPDERFILYPLHFEPEAATHVLGPTVRNQVANVQRISALLPEGVRLLVKEHPMSLGRRPAGYYRALQGPANVTVLDPSVDSFDAVARAVGVITVSGTMGWEAYLMGTHVAVLGEVFYRHAPGVASANSDADLRCAIDSWMAGVPAPRRGDKSAWAAFVNGYRSVSKPGQFLRPETDPSVLSTSNLDALANAVEEGLSFARVARP